jgi:hypothetical protein
MGSASIRSQDILLLCKLIVLENPEQSRQKDLASSLCINQSEVSTGLERLAKSHLIDLESRCPSKMEVYRFLEGAIQYFFPAEYTEYTIGMPTSIFVEPLKSKILEKGIPLVWPDSSGKTKGLGLVPLYESVPEACKSDEKLYQLVSVIDALRSKKSARLREEAQFIIRKFVFGTKNEL